MTVRIRITIRHARIETGRQTFWHGRYLMFRHLVAELFLLVKSGQWYVYLVAVDQCLKLSGRLMAFTASGPGPARVTDREVNR